MTLEVINTKRFVKDTAKAVVSIIHQVLDHSEYCVLGLSGGTTPQPVYRMLASIEGIAWNRVVITFGDERCVPPDSPDSNYKMVRSSLLDHIDIPAGNVLRIKGENEPHAAAIDYEQNLRDTAVRLGLSTLSHDLLLLGLGDDGHTASLFPGTRALDEADRWAIENYVPKLSAWRITMTFPLINASRVVLFMVNDAKKQRVVDEILEGGRECPASFVKPTNGELLWYVGS